MGKEPGGNLNAWTTPSSLLGIFGFVALVFSGFQQFQDDTVKDIAVLQAEVRFLAKEIADLRRDQRGERRERSPP